LTKGGPTVDEAKPFPLYAGQHDLVGQVLVWDNGRQLCVKYELNAKALEEGWLIYETHVDAATTLGGIPQKKGNPPPGKLRYGDDDLPGVAVAGPYYIPFEDIIGFTEGLDLCDADIVIAAHAVIEKTECKVIVPAPYSACNIVEYLQGLRQDGTAVKTERSFPENALYYEIGKNESNFFSLGFGGWMILEFGCPITNGDGSDIRIIEDTWGTYPVEKAMVSASQNGIDWTELGEANNEARDPVYNYHTISEFDLGDLEWATYIKVVDTTDISLYGSRPNAEGYDLNAVLALHDCEECTTYSETAWGAVFEGFEPFPGKNWATYFNYDVQHKLGCPGIDSLSGNIQVLDSPPANVQVGSLENDDFVRVWKEFEGPLPVDLYYDLDEGDVAKGGIPVNQPKIIPSGTEVCIFYVHFDNEGSTSRLEQIGQITFGVDILGLIISGGNIGDFADEDFMFDADDSIGNLGTTYPTKSGNDYKRGFDVNWSINTDDAVFNDATVDFTMFVVEAHDSFRVIVPRVPVPCE